MEPEERERRLQARVQELVNTVERVTQNAELRHQQSTELVNDVKKANASVALLSLSLSLSLESIFSVVSLSTMSGLTRPVFRFSGRWSSC